MRAARYPRRADGAGRFNPTTDCLTVQGGQFQVTLLKGEAKVYVPQGSVLAAQRQ